MLNHGHTHALDTAIILSTKRGIAAARWSFLGLLLTALAQAGLVWVTGSVALLADTIHNFADAATAIPLWFAFRFARLRPTRRFTYGLSRVEDLAGLVVVLVIFASACLAGFEAVERFLHPKSMNYPWVVAAASLIGFLGNEAVAFFRIKVGKEIGSAALIADGYHARVDGFVSLAVMIGAAGAIMGYKLADPLVAVFITLVIMRIVWDSAKLVVTRLLDGVDPDITEDIENAISQLPAIAGAADVRVRWLGHRLHAELNIGVAPELSVSSAHELAVQAEQELLKKVPHLFSATIHVDPIGKLGSHHHRQQGASPDKS